MNVLLSCIGRRSYLVEYFRAAVLPRGRVIVTNSEANSPGVAVANTSWLMPPVDADYYIDALLEVVQKEDVGLLVPLMDVDLPYLAAARSRFERVGVTVAVSTTNVVEIVNDKWEAFKFLSANRLPTPKTFLTVSSAIAGLENGGVEFPLIVKPRWGMGSKSVYRIDDIDELIVLHRRLTREVKASYLRILSKAPLDEIAIIQQCIDGIEYGLDVFNDLEGNHLVTVVKQKLAMRSGETDAAITVRHSALHRLGESLAAVLRHRANLDLDVIVRGDGAPFILDLNARFGGGYPFSHLAGARFPEALVAMCQGRVPECGTVRPGILGHKFIVPRELMGGHYPTAIVVEEDRYYEGGPTYPPNAIM